MASTEDPTIDPTKLWVSLSTPLIANTIVYIIAQLKKDNGIVDIMWGQLFVLPNLVYLLWSQNWNQRTILTFALVSLWAFRLSAHILMRHGGEEDYRYQAMRRKWEAKGKTYYYIVSYLFVFVMQAVFSLVVNASALYVSLYSTKDNVLGPLDYAGVVVFLIGFLIQAAADASLYSFKKDPANKGKIIKHNVWRYSRHPNYFGESLMWWGIYLIACSVGKGYWTFYSALFITLLVRFVSGVPLLERKQKKNPEFLKYMQETNVFVPWFVRKINDNEEQLIDKKENGENYGAVKND
ncbi:membrane protein [Stylonychia lemnae]|uniref:Membrane protein n=1 Tax=Stylonychia lemnae TaxID=5949 RepID=A0A078AFB3_STYLE|nr:membrane protein [Stylonychia lemnae]|eukprot:CDW80929.1 membrane protein [Stylonychia lemnae]